MLQLSNVFLSLGTVAIIVFVVASVALSVVVDAVGCSRGFYSPVHSR